MSTSGIGNSSNPLVNQMFQKDTNQDGKLSQAEYKDYLAGKSSTGTVSSAAAAAAFDQLDKDGDGSVTQAEAENFFALPTVNSASLLDSTTTSSLLDALTAENTASTNSSPDVMTQLLQSYTAAQGQASSSTFSEDA